VATQSTHILWSSKAVYTEAVSSGVRLSVDVSVYNYIVMTATVYLLYLERQEDVLYTIEDVCRTRLHTGRNCLM
jgi:hypothetical protein